MINPRNKPPICTYCGRFDLNWAKHTYPNGQTRWRLVDAKTGALHSCMEYINAQIRKRRDTQRAKKQAMA